MQITNRSLKALSWLKLTAIQNSWFGVPQVSYSSTAGAIKMAFNVFNSSGTQANLPPIVVMHGLFGSKQNWRTTGKILNETTKRKVYAVDARNHGDSPHSTTHNAQVMAVDVLHLLENEKIDRAVVMGHSMGGRAMMSFALQFPKRVDKAIIVDISPVSMPDDDSRMNSIFKALQELKIDPKLSMAKGRQVAIQKLNPAVGDPGTVSFIMLNLKKNPSGEFEWRMNVNNLKASFKNMRDKSPFNLPPFSGPVLFIGGKHSPFIPKSDWPGIQKIFPKAQLEMMDAHHLVHMEKPQEFVQLVAKFLSK